MGGSRTIIPVIVLVLANAIAAVAAQAQTMRDLVRQLEDKPMSEAAQHRGADYLWRMLLPHTRLTGDRLAWRLEIGKGCEQPHGAWATLRDDRPVVAIDPLLIQNLYRANYANAYIHARAPDSLDKRNALGVYMREIARDWARGLASRQPADCSAREVEAALAIPPADAAQLRADREFWQLVNINWHLTMMFVLAHEIAHLELGHHRTPPTAQDWVQREVDADRRAIDIANSLDPQNAVAGTLAQGYFLAALYEYAEHVKTNPNSELQVTSGQVRELCLRTADLMTRMLLSMDSVVRQRGSPISPAEVEQTIRDAQKVCNEYAAVPAKP